MKYLTVICSALIVAVALVLSAEIYGSYGRYVVIRGHDSRDRVYRLDRKSGTMWRADLWGMARRLAETNETVVDSYEKP